MGGLVKTFKRKQEPVIRKDLEKKLVLLSGPRQVGKTTLAQSLCESSQYLNFDSLDDRQILLERSWDRSQSLIIFDEIHKMKNWKSWLKWIYDKEKSKSQFLVALALKKEIERLEDQTGRKGDLYYLQTKEKKEVDFLVLVEGLRPLLVEVKASDTQLSGGLVYFVKSFKNPRAVQLVRNLKPEQEKTFENGIEVRAMAPWLASFSLEWCDL